MGNMKMKKKLKKVYKTGEVCERPEGKMVGNLMRMVNGYHLMLFPDGLYGRDAKNDVWVKAWWEVA